MTISFLSGSMFGGKSKTLIECIELVKQDEGYKYLVFKPTNDTRDGLFIKSRDHRKTIPAFGYDEANKLMPRYFEFTLLKYILDNKDRLIAIFFDEIHFLTKETVEFIVETCKRLNVDLYMSGLETDFKLEYFPSSKYLKGVCDSYFFLSGKCNSCGKEATYNILIDEKGDRVTEGESIHPGNDFIVLCESCV